ncbi:hypothetical protein [Oryzihumus leptocrescens]|uniref:LPXTG-motif cell wall-anchored protein n=1 Tax=Oryzihumus leptocrescens TaxID=297536 RepID=A0A542ZFB1_9MICO|nr:hypothetical protein [Oryzihumus leptocrescens]TQL59007.1 hypothetical protein FB474_0351 [Oryzihumus leptocrescens]
MSLTSAPASTVSVSVAPGRRGPTRRQRLAALLCLAGAAALLPWVAYLSTSLPKTYVLTDWNGAWVGFDVLLMVLLATTGVLTRRQHPLHPHAAFASAAFLVADAWFDVTTSVGSDAVVAFATAGLVELPLAAYLVRHASRSITEAARPAVMAAQIVSAPDVSRARQSERMS